MLSVDDPFSPGVNSDPEFWELAINELQRAAFPDATEFENSPVLGVPLALHSLIFRIIQMCRVAGTSRKDGELRYLVIQLDLWKQRVKCDIDSASTNPRARSPYDNSSALYILAASILLETCISTTNSPPGIVHNASTRDQVTKAIRILQSMSKDDPCSKNYLGTWTLKVIGLAATDENDRKIITDELERRWMCWGSGDIKRYMCNLQSRDFATSGMDI